MNFYTVGFQAVLPTSLPLHSRIEKMKISDISY